MSSKHSNDFVPWVNWGKNTVMNEMVRILYPTEIKLEEELDKMGLWAMEVEELAKSIEAQYERKIRSTFFSTITRVDILVPNKVVEVTFGDGTKQKTVCREPDVFSLETAISICLSKQLLGGTAAYNKAIRDGIKVYENQLKKDEAEKAEQERIAKRHAKKKAYQERRNAKREQAEREKAIEIQKEAYIRAMKELQTEN